MKPAKKRPALTWARHGLTILVSAGICVYYLNRVDWHGMTSSLTHVNIPLAVLGAALPQLAWWWADSRMNQLLVRWFHEPVPFRPIFWVRGFTYLALIVFPPLGEAAMLIYLFRRTGMSGRLFAGIMFFKSVNMMAGFLFIVTAATATAYAVGFDLAAHVNQYAWVAGIACGWFGLFHAWSYWIAGMSWGPLDRALRRDAEFFIPYARGKMRHWASIWAYSIAPVTFMFIGYYLVALAFDVYISPLTFILLIPLVLTLANLPVFFGGFGSTTIFWQAFFPDAADPTAVIALTLFIPAVRMLVRMAIGLVCLGPAMPDLGLIWKVRKQEDITTDEPG